MSPFVAYHATSRRHRDSIREHGLLLNFERMSPERNGVYVFNDECEHPTFSRSALGGIFWSYGVNQDLWEVAYIGPMAPDHFVNNGIILYERVPPECLSLITHITPHSEVPWGTR